MSPLMFAIIFFAFFTLAVTGFGHALVSMPLLVPLIGVKVAAPLVALASLTGEIMMFIRYRRDLKIRSVWRLVIASVAAIPIGVVGVKALDERLVLAVLGVVVVGYGLYALLDFYLPEIKNPNWAFGFGFAAGLLGGAYNTGGPPVVIYGSLSRWPPAEFKSSLQGMFMLNSVLVISAHALSGNITPLVIMDYLVALPAVVLGLLVGWWVERLVNPAFFRRLIFVMLIVLGLRLIFSG